MFNRFYDSQNRYTAGVLKEYVSWMLEVSYRQHTLGCFMIFCKRQGVEKISQLTTEELVELKSVMAEIEIALITSPTFQPDRFNYIQLGNTTYQLHFHGIPRYSIPRTFGGKEWEDPTFRSSPPWTAEEQSHETVTKLKEAILPFLKQ